MTRDFHPEHYINYLKSIARVQLAMGGPVRNKMDASDLVQDVLLQAHAKLAQFRGQSDGEFAAWLRKILANKLADAQRRQLRKKRDAALEVTYQETIDNSADNLCRLAIAQRTTPSQHLVRHERELLLAEALNALPETQRTAVELFHLAEQPLAEVARLMGHTKPGVAGLLARGRKALRRNLEMLAPT